MYVFDSIVYEAGDDGRSPGVGTITLRIRDLRRLCEVSTIVLGACRRVGDCIINCAQPGT